MEYIESQSKGGCKKVGSANEYMRVRNHGQGETERTRQEGQHKHILYGYDTPRPYSLQPLSPSHPPPGRQMSFPPAMPDAKLLQPIELVKRPMQ